MKNMANRDLYAFSHWSDLIHFFVNDNSIEVLHPFIFLNFTETFSCSRIETADPSKIHCWMSNGKMLSPDLINSHS